MAFGAPHRKHGSWPFLQMGLPSQLLSSLDLVKNGTDSVHILTAVCSHILLCPKYVWVSWMCVVGLCACAWFVRSHLRKCRIASYGSFI